MNDIKFLYLSDSKGRWRATVARRTVKSAISKAPYIQYGVALCHPSDQFIKKEGRKMAVEKLEQSKGIPFVKPNCSIESVLQNLANNSKHNVLRRLARERMKDFAGNLTGSGFGVLSGPAPVPTVIAWDPTCCKYPDDV